MRRLGLGCGCLVTVALYLATVPSVPAQQQSTATREAWGATQPAAQFRFSGERTSESAAEAATAVVGDQDQPGAVRPAGLVQAMLQESELPAPMFQDELVPEPPRRGPAAPARPADPVLPGVDGPAASNGALPGTIGAPAGILPGTDDAPAARGGAAEAAPRPLEPAPTPRRVAEPGLLPHDPAYRDMTLSPEPAPSSPFELEPDSGAGVAECGDGGASGCCSDFQCGSPGGTPTWRGAAARWLRAIEFEAWLDQGVTINTLSPRNRSNRPVTFNDGSNEYQMNQLYLVLDKPVDDSGWSWDLGGRVDFLYGTDARFTGSRGLELRRDGAPKWNSEDYGLSMPQLYAEIYAPWWRGVRFKLGHFYTILGYETVPAVDNFFYSHSYTMQYGEPFTHTGLLASAPVGPFHVNAGFSRGWDNWEDNNNGLDVLAGISWKTPDERIELALAACSGPEQDEPPSNANMRTVYSLVGKFQLTERWLYVVQHDLGIDENAVDQRDRDAHWFGLNQYLFYTFNPYWSGGLRFEWFRDEDAYRIDPVNAADYYELTLGVNYKPSNRLICRSELRWDWATGMAPGYRPFGDGTEMHQVLIAFDAIVRF